MFEQFQARALKPGARYVASVRMHLDLSQLPKPLQINALVNTDWGLDSDWHQWTMGADTPAGRTGGFWDFN